MTTPRKADQERVFFLVRHGLTEWNERGRLMGRSEIGLSPRGRQQAEAAAAALAAIRIDAVLCSPQRRARETADAIAAPHALPVETVEDLAEVWLGERWIGKTFEDLRDDPDMLRYFADPTFGGDVLETARSVELRVSRVVSRLEERRESRFVVVSHGDPLRILLTHFLGLDVFHYRKFAVANGAINVLRSGRGGRQLVALGCQPNGLPEVVGAGADSLPRGECR
jgi:broad specificity phosphatase PhoE